MQSRITRAIGAGRWAGRLSSPVCALLLGAVALGPAMADGLPAPVAAAYRIVQLSPDTQAFGDVNAWGQVAFNDRAGDWRARFYDGTTIHDIGTLGGPSAQANALNDLGQVVGGARIDATSSRQHAFIWSRHGGIRDLHPPGQEQRYSFAVDVNNRGQVAGSSDGAPFRWRATTGFQALATNGQGGEVRALNDAGVVVGAEQIPDEFGNPRAVPVRWPAPGIREILVDQGSIATGARDINAWGQIVGTAPLATNPFIGSRAFVWNPLGGLLPIATELPSQADKINDFGLVIGSLRSQPSSHGFVWSRTRGLVEIGAGSPASSSARDVNNLGQVVGQFDGRAYSWTRAEGVVDLNGRVPGAPAGLVLREGQAISDSGAILATANTGLVLLVPGTAACNPPVAAPITLTGDPRTNALLSFSAPFRDADPRDAHKALWSWGDGSQDAADVSAAAGAGNASGQHAYRAPGTYTVQLTVSDSKGRSTTVRRQVVVPAAGIGGAG